MATSVLILHGLANHRPPDHWQFWLAGRLAERGHQVAYPSLPEPDAPAYADWDRVLREQLSLLDGDERVVVCHSLACMLWFHSAASLPEAGKPDRLLLVSPPATAQLPPEAAEFGLPALDAVAVRASVRGEICIACSDNDPYNPDGGAAGLYAAPLGLEVTMFRGAAHINPGSGHGPWPFALDWCTGSLDRA
jgi:predicted alpha/beta hydrolase family esterase